MTAFLRVSITERDVAQKIAALARIKQCTVDALVTAYLEKDLAAVPLSIVIAQDAGALKAIDRHVATVRQLLAGGLQLDAATIRSTMKVSLPTCTKVLKHMIEHNLIAGTRRRGADGGRTVSHYRLLTTAAEAPTAGQRALQACQDAIAAQPTPKPMPLEGARGGSALERNATLLHDLLVAHPEGLTVRAVAELTSWCRLTSERALHYLLDAGRVVREKSATGGAPAWCYNAVQLNPTEAPLPAPILVTPPADDEELPPLGG